MIRAMTDVAGAASPHSFGKASDDDYPGDSLVILDWDDTFLCSHYLNRNGMTVRHASSSSYALRLTDLINVCVMHYKYFLKLHIGIR